MTLIPSIRNIDIYIYMYRYIFVVRVATFSSQVKGLRDRLYRDSYRHFQSFDQHWKNRINWIREADSFQENRARLKGNIFVNENLCNRWPRLEREREREGSVKDRCRCTTEELMAAPLYQLHAV